MAASKTKPKRRKIFPHLENETKSKSRTSRDDNNDSGEPKSDSTDGASYDNAKSRRKKRSGKLSSDNGATKNGNESDTPNKESAAAAAAAGIYHHHLLPLPLVLAVLVCSGLFWIASFRDAMATGKPILDTLGVLWWQEDADANFLVSHGSHPKPYQNIDPNNFLICARPTSSSSSS